MHPMEVIDQEEITVRLNGEEACTLMKVIAESLMHDFIASGDIPVIYSILKKLGPGIQVQAAKQDRLSGDELN